MVKDYDCEIMYHSEKAKVVVDALSRKMAGSSIDSLCMRISIDSPLLDLIREDQAEGVMKENWKQERLMGEVDRFATDRRGLLTWYRRVWVPDFFGVWQTVLEEVHKSRFLIHHGATKLWVLSKT